MKLRKGFWDLGELEVLLLLIEVELGRAVYPGNLADMALTGVMSSFDAVLASSELRQDSEIVYVLPLSEGKFQ